MPKRTITKNDLTAMKFTGAPKISPDGKQIVYVLTTINEELNGYESSLYLVSGHSDPKPFTRYHSKEKLIKDTEPCWSVDGEYVYFLSNRDEKQQVWRLPVCGGEAEAVTDFEEGVDEFALSPCDNQLVCTVTTPDTKKTDDNEDVTIVTRLRYLANGKGFIKGWKQLYHVDLLNHLKKKLTEDHVNSHSPAFTPDSKAIVYLKGKHHPEKSNYFSDITKLNLTSLEEILLYEGKGSVSSPQVSHDSQWVAFAGHEGGEISPDNNGLWLIGADGGEAQCLTKAYNRPVGNLVGADASYDSGNLDFLWDADSRSVTFIATEGGNVCLKRADLNGKISDVFYDNNGGVTSFDMGSGCLTFVLASPVTTGDLYLQKGGEPQQVTAHNQELFNEIELAEPQFFTYEGADGWTIEGWVLFPPDTTNVKEKIPVVLEIHGGPATAYGNAFHHEFQCLAAEGYAVVYTNPRGSEGYGREFTAANFGDWGNKDREDIMKGLDYVLDHYPQCDPDHLFVTGGSYGGFMTNMIVSHTNRFKGAVTQRCISNMYSFFGTSDIGYFFGDKQLGGVDLWDDEDKIMSFSPIRYARNVRTPTCIIHSEEDYRCPMEQAEQWYVALTRLGVETKFVRFKGENHELSRSGKPKNRLTRLDEIIGWFNKYKD